MGTSHSSIDIQRLTSTNPVFWASTLISKVDHRIYNHPAPRKVSLTRSIEGFIL